MAGAPIPPGGPGYVVPPYQPPGPQSAVGTPQGANWAAIAQSIQIIQTTLNAILAQLKAGISTTSPVQTFAFAGLPSATANPGLVVFCSNALKPGQGTGAGTGMLAFSDGHNWISTAGTTLAS
jgi:hypothetical protein